MRPLPLVLASLLFAAGCNSETSLGLNRPDLSGRVTIDGRPASGITVVATNASRVNTVVTGPNGEYAFSQIPFGSTTVSVRGLPDFVVLDHPTYEVELGTSEFEVNFTGYSAIAVSGSVLWEYATDRTLGVSGVSAHIEQPTFPVADVASGSDGSFTFPRAPGYGDFLVVFGALPAGLHYINSSFQRYSPQAGVVPTRVPSTYVRYDPSAALNVVVLVDGAPYSGAVVNLATPLPVRDAPGEFQNLPVSPLEVRLSGFPSSITFDATVKTVPLLRDSMITVTFTGYSAGANRPPVPTILAPANGARISAGTPITLRGAASDPEDGALRGTSLQWYTPGDTTYGTGDVLTIGPLPAGPHRFILRATDSRGSEATAIVDVTIVPATGGTVAGTIRVGGDRTYDAHLILSTTPARTAITDSQGQFALEDVPPGTYTITIQPVECAEFNPTSRVITVVAGATTVADFTGHSVYCYDYGIRAPGSKAVRPPP